MVYLGIALAVDYFCPQKVMAVGEAWCFDDWCLTVENVRHTDVSDEVQLRISSTARRVSQRAKGAWIYLIDASGRRYSPNTDPNATPLSVELAPLESVRTTRVFSVPAGVRSLGLITGHGAPYCSMSLLIIGEGGCLFQRPTLF